MILEINTPTPSVDPPRSERWHTKTAKWEVFQDKVQELIGRWDGGVIGVETVEQAYTYFVDAINTGATDSMKRAVPSSHSKSSPWWNDEVERAVEHRFKCLTDYYNNKNLRNVAKYEEADIVAKQVVAKAKRDSFRALCEDMSTRMHNRPSAWAILRHFASDPSANPSSVVNVHKYQEESCDGSKTASRASAAVICQQHLTQSGFRLPDISSSYLAENIALLKALEHLEVMHPNCQNALIMTDSKSTIADINNLKYGSFIPPHMQHIVNHIERFTSKPGAKLHLQWIPSHVGILANEMRGANCPHCRYCKDHNEVETIEHIITNCRQLRVAMMEALGGCTIREVLSNMSLASKITLTLCCATSVGIIGYVHFKQQEDREKLKGGVLRDIEQQQMKKAQNLYTLELQKNLENKYKEAEALEKARA
ncbi:hypothetical protein GE061_002402 [Apolygus lucorum]|uniref:RNase H type-1 domain-containing protein n=1 Tax=Apolygus lucorum TaxID=248454 RepID=A0A8S9X500_APOLU|nr:hypothetical protein GE061_002402 [Apolygus lucorum]